MAGMKRFVTYIYAYENHNKGANAGFAKFEVRGEECRIEIHLRGFIGRTTCKIYLFRLENGKMEGLEIGELGVMNGAGDFRILLPANHICGSPYGIYHMEGLVIFSEDDRMFLSRWTEGESFEAAKENFRVWKPQSEPQPKSEQPEPAPVLQSESEQPEPTFVPQQKSAPESVPVLQQESAPAQQRESVPEPQRESASEPQRESAPEPQRESAPVSGDPVENVTATEIPMKNVFPRYTWQDIWENLQKNHPLYQPFENTGIQCLRIELQDLRELPRRYWYLGNNSFLLHGFFNYRYLILGKEKNNYFIGIPGIFQRQEHVMATIFGFPEFLPTMLNKKERANTELVNRFGFWFRYMEE